MIKRILFGAFLVLALALPARAQMSVATKSAFLSRTVLADVQGTLGGAVDTGFVSVAACRSAFAWVKNTGTAGSAGPQIWASVAGVAYGETAGYLTASATPAGGASLITISSSFMDAVRISYAATVNATVRITIYCAK